MADKMADLIRINSSYEELSNVVGGVDKATALLASLKEKQNTMDLERVANRAASNVEMLTSLNEKLQYLNHLDRFIESPEDQFKTVWT